MIANAVSLDYYAVLQVHPDADIEVIEAAYRQLMKKHHPDMAGDDPRRIAENEDRAKTINQAFAVLRDPERRRRYDLDRLVVGTVRARSEPWPRQQPPSSRPTPPPPAASPPNATSASAAPPTADPSAATYVAPRTNSWLFAPLNWIAAAYYLLPGPYEWEGGRNRELTTVFLVPPTGIAAYLLANGRLTPLIGHTLTANLAAWGILALVAALLMWGSMLRVAIAAAPGLALLSGMFNPLLQDSQVPVWLAWCLLSCVSLLFAARLFVFAVLPTLVIILLIS